MVDPSTLPLGDHSALDLDGSLELQPTTDKARSTDPDASTPPKDPFIESKDEASLPPAHNDLHRQFQEAELVHYLLPSTAEYDKLQTTVAKVEAHLQVLEEALAQNHDEMDQIRRPVVHPAARVLAMQVAMGSLAAAERLLRDSYEMFTERYREKQAAMFRKQARFDDEGLRTLFETQLCRGLFRWPGILDFSLDRDYEKDFNTYYEFLVSNGATGSSEFLRASTCKTRMNSLDLKALSEGFNAKFPSEYTLKMNRRRRQVDCYIAIALTQVSVDLRTHTQNAQAVLRDLRQNISRVQSQRVELCKWKDVYGEMRSRALDVLPKAEENLKESVLQMVVLAKLD